MAKPEVPLALSARLCHWDFPAGSVRRTHLPAQETRVQSLGWEDPLEKEMAAHSSILAWEIPWSEKPGAAVHRVTKS